MLTSSKSLKSLKSSTTDWSLLIGRALLAVPFVTGGAEALAHPGLLPDFARTAGVPHPELATRAAAGAMVVGAVAMGTGVAPVLGGTVLAGSLVGATLTVHNFWIDQPEAPKTAHRKAFLANCGLLGAILIVTARARAALAGGRADG